MGNSLKFKGYIWGGVTTRYYKEKREPKIRSQAKDLPGIFQTTISCVILLFYTLYNVVLA